MMMQTIARELMVTFSPDWGVRRNEVPVISIITGKRNYQIQNLNFGGAIEISSLRPMHGKTMIDLYPGAVLLILKVNVTSG